MGRLEKIVVLTVVFLIAVILGVSLNETDVGDPVPDGSDPLLSSRVVDAPRELDGLREVATRTREPEEAPAPIEILGTRDRERLQPVERGLAAVESSTEPRVERIAQLDHRSGPAAAEELRPTPGGRARLLNSAVQLEDEPAPEADETEEVASILVRTAGLARTHDDQYMLYTWKEGDTFTSIARAYYDSMAHVRLLRLANEGRTERDLTDGDKILVPVFDPDGSTGNDRAYTVAEGDTLSSIAQKIYGDSSKYRKIFEANRDVLNDENTLALGQELRIPR